MFALFRLAHAMPYMIPHYQSGLLVKFRCTDCAWTYCIQNPIIVQPLSLARKRKKPRSSTWLTAAPSFQAKQRRSSSFIFSVLREQQLGESLKLMRHSPSDRITRRHGQSASEHRTKAKDDRKNLLATHACPARLLAVTLRGSGCRKAAALLAIAVDSQLYF
jgi:hypothetical protein